jgi:purine-binding chemotaxis protein CheW
VNLEDQIQLVAFRVGGQEFALEILQVERILRYERPSPLPKAPDFLEGIVTYGGAPIPVVDLRKRLEVPAPVDEQTRLMVLAIDDHRVAVTVDEVREVLRVDSTTIIAPPPIVRGLAAEYIAGLVTRGERTLVLLQAGRLLSSAERLALSDAGIAE